MKLNTFLLIFFIYLLFLTFLLGKYNFNITSLISFGENTLTRIFPNQPFGSILPSGTMIFKDIDGYDGQFYYLVARSLLPSLGEDRDIQRQQRIFYSLSARILALGQEKLLPASLLLVNLLAIFLGTLAFSQILPKGSFWALLIFAFSPLYILGLQYDLTDPLSLTLGVAGLLFYVKEKVKISSLCLALGLLSRETTILFLIPIVITEISARHFKKAYFYLSSVIPFIIYQVFLNSFFGKTGLNTSFSNNQISLPFQGILIALSKLRFETVSDSIRSLSVVLVLLAIILCGLHLATIPKRVSIFNMGILVCVVFACLAGFRLWEVYGSAGRVFTIVTPFILVSHYQKKTYFSSAALFVLALLSIFTLLRPFLISPNTQFMVIP